MEQNTVNQVCDRRPRRMAGGIILILVGAAALLGRWVDLGSYLVLLLGAVMLLWGVLAHSNGLIIPGGVLSGIGLGILAMESPWKLPFTSQNGVFLVCFALGWFLITLLSGLAAQKTLWWALVPGGIMAFLGGVTLLGGEGFTGLIWPAALIVIGLFLILRWGKEQPKP